MNSVRTDVHAPLADTPPGVSEADFRLSVRAAMLYKAGLTQSEIGERLGYSRIKINRVLALARTHGVLEIKVNVPAGWNVELETELIRLFGLRDAVVVSSEESDRSLESVIAEGAAAFLADHLESGMRVGVGIGRTVAHLPERFRPDRRIDCSFIELVGAAYTSDWARFDVTYKMAELAGGRREGLHAPGYLTDPELSTRLAQEPAVAATLERARTSDIMVQSVGPVETSAILFQYGVLSIDDLDDLRDRGAVGDALGYYYDIDGNHVDSPTDPNLIGIVLDDLKSVPWSVLVAGGKAKVAPIVGGLRGSYFNTLVTDDETAQSLLDYAAGGDQ